MFSATNARDDRSVSFCPGSCKAHEAQSALGSGSERRGQTDYYKDPPPKNSDGDLEVSVASQATRLLKEGPYKYRGCKGGC